MNFSIGNVLLFWLWSEFFKKSLADFLGSFPFFIKFTYLSAFETLSLHV